MGALRAHLPDDLVLTVVRDLCKRDFLPEILDVYVDHQSVWGFPSSWDEKLISTEFVQDFSKFLLQENVAILGGGDNDDPHPLQDFEKGFRLAPYVARKDPSGYWLLFNRNSGAKLRMQFPEEGVQVQEGKPQKSIHPELVDIKITGKCSFGCSFCYQDSTPQGTHGDDGYIHQILRSLRDLQVAEVAFGGGEPPLHPKFWDFIADARHYNIVPNFTTRNLAWMANPTRAAQVKKKVGRFAVSVTGSEDLETALACADNTGLTPKMSIQLVMGTMNRWELSSALQDCAGKVPVTLLGWKETGRAGKPTHNYDWWLEREGDFSCYIDAVERKIGVSSYVPETAMLPLPDPQHIAELYAAL